LWLLTPNEEWLQTGTFDQSARTWPSEAFDLPGYGLERST
jgi:hypothetical protein